MIDDRAGRVAPVRPKQRVQETLDRMPSFNPTRRRDATGRVIRVGDVVRVSGVPDLSGMRAPGRRRSRAVFEHIAGTCKRVEAFNALGWAQLSFVIRRGPCAGLHTVWVEPELLRIQRSRR